MAATRLGATPRQARLIDWLRHPTGVPVEVVPIHPAIRIEDAFWTAREIVEFSGLYTSRRACLDDLKALAKTGSIWRLGNRWRYGWLS